MMCWTASSVPRFSGRAWRLTRSASAAMRANEALASTAVRAKPSRSSPANQVFAICEGAPMSSNRCAIGDMSESVSLTSKTRTAGRRGPSGLIWWSTLGGRCSCSLSTPRSESPCPHLDMTAAEAPLLDVSGFPLQHGPRMRHDVGATQS